MYKRRKKAKEENLVLHNYSYMRGVWVVEYYEALL